MENLKTEVISQPSFGQALPMVVILSNQIDSLDDFYGSQFANAPFVTLRKILYQTLLEELNLHSDLIDISVETGLITAHEGITLQVKISTLKLKCYPLAHGIF
jgi:hypothetical protein